jgi:hypothetical protein
MYAIMDLTAYSIFFERINKIINKHMIARNEVMGKNDHEDNTLDVILETHDEDKDGPTQINDIELDIEVFSERENDEYKEGNDTYDDDKPILEFENDMSSLQNEQGLYDVIKDETQNVRIRTPFRLVPIMASMPTPDAPCM